MDENTAEKGQSCECMTEPNPLDPDGPEVVLTHSSRCPLHPDYDPPKRGDCPVCRNTYRLTKAGVMVRHNGPMRSRKACTGVGQSPRPLARVRVASRPEQEGGQ